MAGKILDKIEIPQDRFELRLSGSGGQGMILASVILGEAIGADGTKNITQSQSYGPEARGGASKADVVVSSGEIFYPKAMKLDLLLAMTQESLDSYYPFLKENGTLIVDDVLVTEVPTDNYYGLPFTRLAREEAGHVMVANVIALGAIGAITGIVTHETLVEAVLARAPRGTEEKNRKAVEIGYREGARLLKEKAAGK
ncbi:MAG: 2-oxoacid:acceptor oxidoreductase family protein [candidate division Zixibacteria bacterium]|nr:2-oxoacid:acceptor oxidoreductase family protein [candidate division Zixibacteria bacterium]